MRAKRTIPSFLAVSAACVAIAAAALPGGAFASFLPSPDRRAARVAQLAATCPLRMKSAFVPKTTTTTTSLCVATEDHEKADDGTADEEEGRKSGGERGPGSEEARLSVFEDEECYDLCEVAEEEIVLGDVSTDEAGEGIVTKEDDDKNKKETEPIIAEEVKASQAFMAESIADTMIEEAECYDLCDEEDPVAAREEETTTKQEAEEKEDASSPVAAAAADTVRTPEERASRYRRNLELHWSVLSSVDSCDVDEDMNSCGGPCEECEGTGKVDCRFCGGTGFFTIGTQVMGGGEKCLICKDGEEECKGCRGSGWVARWRNGGTNGGSNLTEVR